MELIERQGVLSLLESKWQQSRSGEGHTVFVTGEAGIGKTSLVKAFCKGIGLENTVFIGSCDALFTPRPLAPLYDVALQLIGDDWLQQDDHLRRTDLFTRFYQEVRRRNGDTVIVFEDVHWADEATFDFIKFLARRITTLRCLFIITHRNDECLSIQLLRNIVGQLAPDTFTRIPLSPLSREAVDKLSAERGYRGEDVYSISGGIPFYVNEILAAYSHGVPANIKDSILSIYNQVDPRLGDLWETLSILPTGLEFKYLEQLDTYYLAAFESCFTSGILVLKDNAVSFKHELYRRAIEETLSPMRKMALNKKILDLFAIHFEANHELERIVHHAKAANEYEMVVRYAPVAAAQAAALGAHIEAARLYQTALEFTRSRDKEQLVKLYEAYAYECYLINQTREAIVYTEKACLIWKDLKENTRMTNSLRFLSRLWWFEGNRKKAEQYAQEAIQAIRNEPVSAVKAMAYSNMAQLKMLEDNYEECVQWGEQAIAMARELDDQEILSHALNNVGTVKMNLPSTKEKGRAMVQLSLSIALQNDFQEHAARAYTNLASSGTKQKEYSFALHQLEEGIRYCEDRDLHSWMAYMTSWLARVYLETGKWDKATQLSGGLLDNERQPPIIRISALIIMALLKMRRGEQGMLPYLLEAKRIAFDTMEAQRIQPVTTALLEYEWLTGKPILEDDELDESIRLLSRSGTPFETGALSFWLLKSRNRHLTGIEAYPGYTIPSKMAAKQAGRLWAEIGCPYEEALVLFEGTAADKKEALEIMQKLEAVAVIHKMKQLMRQSGMKHIPRGLRSSTQTNPAHLTNRELGILQLLYEGMPNKEIADKLFISPKTVDHHISSILNKLDVNTRSKAAKEAMRLGIVK